jgi:3-oxoacyl-[acyl-carrier protein] reductase
MTADRLITLDGRIIIVTGAAQGIGRAVAQLAADLGAKVALIDVNETALAEVRTAIGVDRCRTYTGSVADPEFVNATVSRIIAEFGGLHGLVNNAGITRPAMANKMTLQQWNEVININLTGIFLMLQVVGRHFIEKAQAGDKTPGRIVNISSDAGRKGTIGQINYGAAKAGVLGITMSAAREWGRYGINVNSGSFGLIDTPMTETIRGPKFVDKLLQGIPMGRMGTPEEVAKPICFLLSDGASYITGQHLSMNGGSHMGF